MSGEVINKGKILVISTDNAVNDAIKIALQESNYHVFNANNTENGIEVVRNNGIELIIVDCDLIKLKNCNKYSQLKNNPDTRHIPVIFIINNSNDKVKAFEVGASDFITKPLIPEEINVRIVNQYRLIEFQKLLDKTDSLLEPEVKSHAKEANNINSDLKAAKKEPLTSNDSSNGLNSYLLEGQLLTKLLSDLTTEGILVHCNNVVYDVNKAFCNMFGLIKEEIIGGNPLNKIFPPDSAHIISENINNRINSPYIVEAIGPNKEKLMIEIEARDFKIKNENYRTTSFRDISSKLYQDKLLKTKNIKLVETEKELKATNIALQESIRQLKESELKLNEAQKLASIGHYNLNFNTGQWTSSTELNSIFGIDPNYSKTVEGWVELIHPDFKEEMVSYLTNKVIGENQPFNKEYKITRHDTGENRWVHGLGTLITNSKGEPKNMLGSIQDITVRKNIELEKDTAIANLQVERDLLHALMSNIPDAIYFKDTQSKFTRINKAKADHCGLRSTDEAIGKTDFDYASKEHANQTFSDEQEIIKTGLPLINKVEKTHYFDGKVRWVSSTKVPLCDKKGKVTGVVGISRDITEQKEAERKLQESEEKYRSFIANSFEGVSRFEFHPPLDINLPLKQQTIDIYNNMIIAEANDSFAKMYGFKVGHEIMNKPISYIWGNIESVSLAIESFIKNNYRFVNDETYEIDKDGNAHYFLNFGEPQFYNKKLATLWITQIDVTKQKKAEQRILESEARFKGLFQHMSSGVAIYEPIENGSDFRFISFNEAAERITNIKKSETIGNTLLSLFPNMGKSSLFRTLQEVYNSGNDKHLEPFYYSDHHREGWRENRIYKLSSGEIVAIFDDVTERVTSERKLKQSEERFRTLADNIPGVVFISKNDEKHTPVYVSSEIEELLGYQKESFLSAEMTFLQTIHPDDLEMVLEKTYDFANRKSEIKIVYRVVTKNNEVKWVEEFSSGIYNNNKLVLIEGVVFDITERKYNELVNQARLRIAGLSSTNNATIVLQKILDEAETLTSSKIGFYHFINEDMGEIQLNAWSTNTLKNMCNASGENMHYPIDKAGVWVDCIRERKAIIHNNYNKLKHKKGLPKGHAIIQREMVVPVFRNEKIVAVLGVGNKPEKYTKTEVNLVQQIADLAFEMVMRKKTEEEIFEERNRSMSIIEGTHAGTWQWNVQTGETIFNERWAAIIGYELDELNPVDINTWVKFTHPDDLQKSNEQLTQHFEGKKDHYECEARMKHKDGSWRWVIDRGKVISWTKEGKPLWMFGTHMDNTERKNAELGLLENEHQLQLIFDGSPAIMFLINNKAQIIRMNKTGLEFLNITFDKIKYSNVGNAFNCIVSVQNKDVCGKGYACKYCNINNAILKVFKSGTPQNKVETKLNIIRNGRIQTFIVLISVNVATREPHTTYLVSIDDISESKKTEKAIIESEKRFRTIIETANDAIFIINAKTGLIVDVNKRAETLIGKSRSEFIGEHHTSIQPKGEEENWIKKFLKNVNTKDEQVNYYSDLLHLSGQIIPTELSPAIFELDDGNKYIVGFFRDIRLRREAEKALEESKDRFQQLADTTNEGIIIHQDGVIQNVNRSLLSMSGYLEEEVIGKNVFELFIPLKYQELTKEKLRMESTGYYEIEALRQNGTALPVEVSARSISKQNKKVRVISIRDITEQKQVQQKILQAIINAEEKERKRVAQELHDGLGPILSASKLYVETFLRSSNQAYKEKAQKNLLAGIEEALKQVSTISNNLSPHVLTDFGLEAAINKFIDRVMSLNSIHIEFAFDFKHKMPSEIETTIYRITNELVNNTLKYAQAEHIFIHVFQVDDNLCLLYKDDGIGFDFEETKKKKGGMGLFNLYNRVESLSGSLSFEKPSGRGIIYQISIPVKVH